MDLEKEIERVAQQYRDEGFVVVTHPDADHLPDFAADLGADILATRGNEKALVQIKKTRADVEADPTISHRAEVIGKQPGWRYDLIVLNEGDAFRRITRGSREPSEQEIDRAITEVETLLEINQTRPALVLAWAALEAAMRRVCSDVELYVPKTTPSELLRTLYGNGILTRKEFDLLRETYRLRTEVVHGLVSPSFDSMDVKGIIATIRRLLTGQTDQSNNSGSAARHESATH
jgi:hypothetical protein